MAKKDEIRVVVKEPGKKAEVRMVENELEALQKIVGGYLERIASPETGMEDRILGYVNEEGNLTALPPNIEVRLQGIEPTLLRGTLFLSKCDAHGEELGLTEQEAEKYKALLDRVAGL